MFFVLFLPVYDCIVSLEIKMYAVFRITYENNVVQKFALADDGVCVEFILFNTSEFSQMQQPFNKQCILF